MKKYYVVIDTNVLASSLLSKNKDSSTALILDAVIDQRLVPLYSKDILIEYEDVLNRKKFRFSKENIETLLKIVKLLGVEVMPDPVNEVLPDMDDIIFYEVVMEKREDDAYLVTGNLKHFPSKHFIVTPAEMIKILNTE